MKRVYCLYRVSTAQQVDVVKDDIPMQRIACHDFAARIGWTILVEKEEKGISGFKVSAEKRDAIQELKEAALNKEFDVLLVFMFDRLGRIENETPFVLEWFADHGIEVWSVNEGQQKFDQHVDKLMNYIRFWQASGESEKTSIRVKTRMHQMVAEGIYTGGSLPYGYMLVDKGRKNKKGQVMRDLAICPEEAEVVREVFRMIVEEGYGSHRMASYLNKKGLKTHNDRDFTSSYILRIMKNEIYRGFLSKGGVKSERLEDLQIIPDKVFFQVQNILEQRNVKNDEKRQIALTNRGKALLSGNIYCGHCGCRLATSRGIIRYTRADGSQRSDSRGRYICYHRSRGLNDCDGASVYDSERIDRAVLKAMSQIFASISGCPEEEKIEQAQRKVTAEFSLQKKRLEDQIRKDTKQLESLRSEIVKSLAGESDFSGEDLATALRTLREKLDAETKELEKLKAEEADEKRTNDMIIPAYRQFKTWSVEFEESSFEAKKVIAGQLFRRIEVRKDYEITYEMNLTYAKFCEEWLRIRQTITATE